MKLKPIEKICKTAGYIALYDEFREPDPDELPGEGELPRQWMSDGVAAYPLDGLPYLDEESVCAIFDVDHKRRYKMTI